MLASLWTSWMKPLAPRKHPNTEALSAPKKKAKEVSQVTTRLRGRVGGTDASPE